MKIKFWGTRGSAPTSGERFLEFGGNTPCLQVELPSTPEVIILDSGTGIRELGADLLRRPGTSRTLHLFLTHAHWDHIQGFPFFGPAYVPGYELHIYCTKDAEDFLHRQMSPPFFPVGLDVMQAKMTFHLLERESSVRIGQATISNIPLPHPQESTGFRVQQERGRAFVFATDTEHGAELNRKLVDFSRGAAALIYDAQYTPEEYQAGKQGWGHSTFSEGARLAAAAEVEKLILFSHDPGHGDEECRRIEKLGQELFPNTVAARQGMTLEI